MRIRATVSIVLILIFIAAGWPSWNVTAQELSIAGAVWQDDNGDGRRQFSEPGIADALLRLTTTSGLLLQTTRTDAIGRYSFGGLDAGQYQVSLGGFAGDLWLQTFPAGPPEASGAGFRAPPSVGVSLQSRSIDVVDFGLFPLGGIPRFSGSAWINAEPVRDSTVRAFVSGVDCSLPPGLRPTDTPANYYSVRVAPAALIGGCGTTGATITFTVNGQPANETASWERVTVQQIPPGGAPLPVPPPPAVSPLIAGSKFLELTVGPPFAVYTGELPGQALIARLGTAAQFRVTAVIADSPCSFHNALFGPYQVSVVPTSVRPGCGVEGALVEFFIDGIKTNETARWTPGFHRLDLTLTPAGAQTRISPPDTGDGGLLR